MNINMKILVLAIATIAFTAGCKDKEESVGGSGGTSTGKLSDADKAKLYDKVWYSLASGGGIDLEFLSDGEFRQAKSLSGSWEWKNNGDTMAIQDYQKKKFNYVFDEITSSTMKFRTNLGGNDYKSQYVYGTEK